MQISSTYTIQVLPYPYSYTLFFNTLFKIALQFNFNGFFFFRLTTDTQYTSVQKVFLVLKDCYTDLSQTEYFLWLKLINPTFFLF